MSYLYGPYAPAMLVFTHGETFDITATVYGDRSPERGTAAGPEARNLRLRRRQGLGGPLHGRPPQDEDTIRELTKTEGSAELKLPDGRVAGVRLLGDNRFEGLSPIWSDV